MKQTDKNPIIRNAREDPFSPNGLILFMRIRVQLSIS